MANINRPGGNGTGVVFFSSFLGPKRLELLRELVPPATIIAVLAAPALPNTEAELSAVEQAAEEIGQQLVVVRVNNAGDIEGAFDIFKQRHAGALFVGAGQRPFYEFAPNWHLLQTGGFSGRLRVNPL